MKRILAAVPLMLALSVCLFCQQATVQEEKQVFKTYPFSGPDPAPIMTRSSMWGQRPAALSLLLFRQPQLHRRRPELERGPAGEPLHPGRSSCRPKAAS